MQKAIDNLKEYLVFKGETVHNCDVTIFIGGDTRPSTSKLLNLLTEGVKS